MALPTNTTTTFDLEGLREDLTNVIYNISPLKTPFSSGIKRRKVNGTYHEWQIDSLAAADVANKVPQGDDTAASAIVPTSRHGNYTQISKKAFQISGTVEAVDKAGRKSEHAYQSVKHGNELKRDIEAILLSATQGGAAASEGTAATAATLLAWIKTNTDKGATGTEPSYTATPSAARGDGTQRAFTEAQLTGVMQKVWTQGGEPTVLMVGPHNRGVASGFAGVASATNEVSRGTRVIQGSMDVYRSDFGDLRIVPNRFQRDRDAWVLDYGMFQLGMLRPLFREDLAKTGDSRLSHMIMEWTFISDQEAASGLVADLETS